MNFISSSHRSRWLFTVEQLEKIRVHNNAASIKKSEALRTGSTEDKQGRKSKPLSLDDEKHLLKYYLGQITHICGALRLPKRVQAAAQIYLKRFYLAHSCMDHDPCYIALTCIYIACKIEENYISAEELTRQLGQAPEVVLGAELKVLQALHFDLIVHNPYRSLAGLFHDIIELRRHSPHQLQEEGLVACGDSVVEKARGEALSTVDALMRMDIPLLFSPGQIAAQCLRVGFKKCGVVVEGYVRRVAEQSRRRLQEDGVTDSELRDDAAAYQQLVVACQDIDRLARTESPALEQKEVAAIDRKLKFWINPLLEANKKAEKGTKEEREARRAAKVAKRRAEQAAHQEKLLGPMRDLKSSRN